MYLGNICTYTFYIEMLDIYNMLMKGRLSCMNYSMYKIHVSINYHVWKNPLEYQLYIMHELCKYILSEVMRVSSS